MKDNTYTYTEPQMSSNNPSKGGMLCKKCDLKGGDGKAHSFQSLLKWFLILFGLAGCMLVSADYPGLLQIFDPNFYHGYSGGQTTALGVRNIIITIFKNIAVVLFLLSVIMAFVSVIVLIGGKESEEDFSKWVRNLAWSVSGTFLLATAYGLIRSLEVSVLNNPSISGLTVYNAVINVIYPLFNMIRFMAGAAFLFSAIFAFYKIIGGVGNEEDFKNGKKIFTSSIVGFVMVMFGEVIVRMAYGSSICGTQRVFGVPIDCTTRIFDGITVFVPLARIIIFVNGLLGVYIVVMLVYAGFLILTGAGDEEKNEKAKKIIMYTIIGILILLFCIVLYRFMIMQG